MVNRGQGEAQINWHGQEPAPKNTHLFHGWLWGKGYQWGKGWQNNCSISGLSAMPLSWWKHRAPVLQLQRSEGGLGGVTQWFRLQFKADWKEWIQYLMALKAPKAYKEMIYATFNAVVYTVWWARNQMTFHEKHITPLQILNQVREQILQRIPVSYTHLTLPTKRIV